MLKLSEIGHVVVLVWEGTLVHPQTRRTIYSSLAEYSVVKWKLTHVDVSASGRFEAALDGSGQIQHFRSHQVAAGTAFHPSFEFWQVVEAATPPAYQFSYDPCSEQEGVPAGPAVGPLNYPKPG